MPADPATDFPPARPSATVVMLRDSAGGPEVLLVLRHANASFGASFVFPGGLCDAGDAHLAPQCDGLNPGTTGFADDEGTAYYSAAVRELFEESGVLLAYRNHCSGELVTDNAFDAYRMPIQNGKLDWSLFLHDKELRLACDRLTYFAWWVTPRRMTRRYSTRFFMTAAPDGQAVSHDGNELTDSRWMRPADALAASSDDMTLPPPTRAVLQDLLQHSSVAAALHWAQEQQDAGVRCILPTLIEQAGEQRVVLPGDPAYPPELDGATE